MNINILIATATTKEIAPFLEYYRNHELQNIDILITGVGLAASTYHLTRQISLKRPGLIVQAGLAGCFNKKIPLSTVLAVQKDVIADEGVLEAGQLKTVFDLKLSSANKYPFSGGWLINKSAAFKKMKLQKVKSVSVNQVSVSPDMIRLIKKKFDPITESMEGASLHYVALMEKIPFIQIRAVSNYIGERNKKKWNFKEAIINLNKELIRIIDSL